ncbi:MAG: hypothetical protein AB3N13_02970 [Arenibacterium sp.]
MTIRKRSLSIAAVLFLGLSVTPVAAEPTITPAAAQLSDGKLLAQIETPEQAVVFANIQNLAARWNTIITGAETGQDMLNAMSDSEVFARGTPFTFNLPDGNVIAFEGLDDPVAQQFYGQFLEGMTKTRHNVTSNVEIVQFTENGADARFRWLVFMGERYSLGGIVQASVEEIDGRYRFTALTLNIQRFDTGHAY